MEIPHTAEAKVSEILTKITVLQGSLSPDKGEIPVLESDFDYNLFHVSAVIWILETIFRYTLRSIPILEVRL
jgi:hypothetical protein